MKKKMLKFQVGATKTQNNLSSVIKAMIVDEHFLKSIDRSKIIFPQNIMQNYSIEFTQKQVICYPKVDRANQLQIDSKNLQSAFQGIITYHVPHSKIEGNEEQLKKQINLLGNHDIIGFKYFHVVQGRFKQGDCLFYAKGPIKQFLVVIANYMTQQKLQFSLDQYYYLWRIPLKYSKEVAEIMIKQNAKNIAQASKTDLNIIILSMGPKIYENDPRWPTTSIQIVLRGDRRKVHQLYEIFEQKISNNFIKVVETQVEPFISERVNCLSQIFPEYLNKICKINQFAVAILNQQIDSEQVERKLKLNTWVIDDKNFTKQQIRTLDSEHKNKSLKPYMEDKNIYWDSLQFTPFQIKLTCDKVTKNKFVDQCTNMLKTFNKQRQICRNFENKFYIEAFRKYYQKSFQDRLSVQFEFEGEYLIRNNFTKYSEKIDQQLKVVREKIRKKIITFVSLFSIKSNINANLKLFQELPKPQGYSHALLGCRLYSSENVKIKMRPLGSLKRQQQWIAYIIDDRLKDQSKFYEIVKKNRINYETFLADAHKSKKPLRLRQYITEDCPYAYRTVLLHAGPQKVTNTLTRDIEALASLVQNRLCVILFKHEGQFLDDVFKVFLNELSILASSRISQNGILIPGRDPLRQHKPHFDLDIYYQGGEGHLKLIQNTMRQNRVRIISPFLLQQFDIQKVYALQYHTMQSDINKNAALQFSPIIAQLCKYQLGRKNKRFVFSSFKKVEHQLVEFIISTKSKKYYKVTHDEGNLSWSRLPHIQRIEDLDHELNQNLSIIEHYFSHSDFVVLSAEAITDGLHGRVMRYCKDLYIAKMNQQGQIQLVPISINSEDRKIHECGYMHQASYRIKANDLKQWYEITTYKQELETINSYLSGAN